MGRTRFQVRPTLEALEHRVVADAKLANGFLTITGGNLADKVTVQEKRSPSGIPAVYVYEQAGTQPVRITTFIASEVSSITFDGGAGNDRFAYTNLTQSAPISVTAYGGPGNDALSGNGSDDYLYGEAGNDTLQGWAGNDHLEGGGGNDRLWGDDGNDVLFGGDGTGGVVPNSNTGADGSDTLYGGAGDDRLDGGREPGSTADRLVGGPGKDTFIADTHWREDKKFGVVWRKVKVNVDRPTDPHPSEKDVILGEDGKEWTDEVKYPPFF